jgi:hypothetical protein
MAAKKSVLLGADRLRVKLKKLELKHGPVSYSVGYTANYALRVHEDLNMNHTNGQAKYLEQPFRENHKRIQQIVRTTAVKTKSISSGLAIAGLFVQKESQKLVPVDTGNLRASAFTRKDPQFVPKG